MGKSKEPKAPKKAVEDKTPPGPGGTKREPGKLDLGKYNLNKDGKRTDGKDEPEDDKKKNDKKNDKKKEEQEDQDEKDGKKKDGKDESGSDKRKKLLGTESDATNEVNEVLEKPADREKFNKKPEQGNMDLRKVFVKMPKNPDLSMKADGGEDMPDDRTKFGGVRLTSKEIEIDKDNFEQFAKAPKESAWLGFIRIGRRVGKPHDSLKLYQIVEKGETGKYYFPANELKAGQSWHATCLTKAFAAKPDSSIKVFNGWPFAEVKAGKNIELVDTGCYFGFFLIKAADGGNNHYLNFGCATLNQAANAVFSDKVPDMPENKMSAPQKAMFLNLVEAERSGFGVHDDFEKVFKGVKLKRGVLDSEGASKKMPLSWAKAVWDALKGD